jgi:hypothetical protein
VKALPTLIRFTPTAANSSNEKVAPFKPMTTLTNLETDAKPLSDGFEPRKPRRIQNISASLRKGLQSPYGLVEIGVAVKKGLGSCSQHQLAIAISLRAALEAFLLVADLANVD